MRNNHMGLYFQQVKGVNYASQDSCILINCSLRDIFRYCRSEAMLCHPIYVCILLLHVRQTI